MPTLCLVEVAQLRTKAVDGRRALFSKKVKTSHFVLSRRRALRDFHEILHVVRAIILGVKRFWLPSIVLPLGVVKYLAENAPIEVNC